ncbi:DUF6578 domain-containing protein [Nocardioides sp. B-3]|uniref:DUF6578 domain-containing protein n=1 Tax=Nocardioides sp. B-3 TaxID=2895565 RepID=UPI0021532214|nr:DUF6578 domain-containing protein [Nocardioides sp. B-3]UUZ60466.1 hypothetical protein LP418_06165 [Nocardioides sp. B-3]
MSELIWISDWQIQCCGSEFAVGDEVTWPVFAPNANHGDTGVPGVTGHYDSHEDPPLPMVTGVVRRIRALSRRGETGTPMLDEVTGIEKWHGIRDAEHTFRGWLVDLEVTP